MARSLKEIADRTGIHFLFKASFDKANRTSVNSFRGPGIHEGCRILGEIAANSASPSPPTSTPPNRRTSPPNTSTCCKSPPSSAARPTCSKPPPKPAAP
jgi:hypothetical protein